MQQQRKTQLCWCIGQVDVQSNAPMERTCQQWHTVHLTLGATGFIFPCQNILSVPYYSIDLFLQYIHRRFYLAGDALSNLLSSLVWPSGQALACVPCGQGSNDVWVEGVPSLNPWCRAVAQVIIFMNSCLKSLFAF